MADKMWDILNFLKNPAGEDGSDKNLPSDADARRRRISAQLEGSLEKQADGEGERADEPAEPEAAGKKESPKGGAQPSAAEAPPEPKASPSKPDAAAHSDSAAHARSGNLIDIPIQSIKPNPFQPRKEMGEAEIMELSESIREFGVLQPIIVRHAEGGYELIAGERRMRAAARAGLPVIPAMVMEADSLDQQIIALVENIQRKNLSSIEEAVSLQDILSKTGWSQTELSHRMGRSQASIANKLRLLKLDPAVQRLVISGKLGERQARSLLSLSADEQKMLAQKAIDEELSTRALEALAENWNGKSQPPRQKSGRNANDGPGGELLGDIAALVNKHRSRGAHAQWKVKQMNQSSLVVEISVDLMKTGAKDEEGDD